jgi:TetR/AcrR family transcriptional regulator, transcriptional repressor for nem operon
VSSPAEAPQAGWFAARKSPVRDGAGTPWPGQAPFRARIERYQRLAAPFPSRARAAAPTGRAGLRTRLDIQYVRTYYGFLPKPSNRERILEAGLKLMIRKGYAGAGVRDIAAEARAPQGSFTNHFRSKEEFAREVLDLYFDGTKRAVAEALEDRSLRPRQRLERYLDLITDRLTQDQFRRGCLIGDFSLEAAPQSEMLRTRLAEIFIEWRRPFAACIAEGQAAGEIAATLAPEELAEFLLASWEGAILRMKVARNAEPLERFKRIAFATVFKEPSFKESST